MKVYTANMLFPIQLTTDEMNTVWDALYGRRVQQLRANGNLEEINNKYDDLMNKVDVDKYMQKLNEAGE